MQYRITHIVTAASVDYTIIAQAEQAMYTNRKSYQGRGSHVQKEADG